MAMDPNKILATLRNEGCDYVAALNTINAEKQAAQYAGDELYANQLWVAETIIEIHQQFVKTFDLLKAGQYYEAWCEAEQVEINIQYLARNSQEGLENVKDINSRVRQLQSLYPYKFFASYVMHVKKEKCSICGKERSIRNFCGHRIGKVYNGELCCNRVTDAELKGIDIVENPVHKYSVLFPSDAVGRHDLYDYTLVEELMKYWSKPFQFWKFVVRQVFKQKAEFPGLTNESCCPCGSGKSYSECCALNAEGIKYRIYTFMVEPIY